MKRLQLTKETAADLNDIRELVAKKDYSALSSAKNLLKLSEVDREILAFSGFRAINIDASCQGCIAAAVDRAYNFITYHEIIPDNKEAKIVNVSTKDKPVQWGKDNKLPEAIAGLKPSIEDTKTGEKYVLPDDFEKMPYSLLLSTAKLYGRKGKKEKAEVLIEFLREKLITKS